jgi:hypothetical protein
VWVKYASRMSKSAPIEVLVLSLLHNGVLTYLLLTKIVGCWPCIGIRWPIYFVDLCLDF